MDFLECGINSLTPGRCSWNLKLVICKLISKIKILSISRKIALNGRRAHWWLVSIGSGNGLVPSGSKPFPESMLTRFYDAYGITRPHWVNIKLQITPTSEMNYSQCRSRTAIFKISAQDFLEAKFINGFINSLWPSDEIWHHEYQSSLVQAINCCLFGTKPLPEPMMTYCQLE